MGIAPGGAGGTVFGIPDGWDRLILWNIGFVDRSKPIMIPVMVSVIRNSSEKTPTGLCRSNHERLPPRSPLDCDALHRPPQKKSGEGNALATFAPISARERVRSWSDVGQPAVQQPVDLRFEGHDASRESQNDHKGRRY
jgi:hypothetical protein